MPDRSARVATETFIYSECYSCGSVFLSRRPYERDIASHYGDEYDPYQRGYNRIADRVVRMRTNREVARMRSFNPSIGVVLEVGASWGKYILHLRDTFGFDVVGVEPNAEMCAIGKKEGLDMRTGTLEDAHFPDASFDCVIMSHVIEHLYDPRATMREVFRILRPGGVVLIKTPNLDTPERLFFGTYWLPYEAPRHILIFSGRTLARLLIESGFLIRRVSFDGTPNNIILSLGNRFGGNFFSINNYLLLALVTPLSLVLGALRKSGRMAVFAQKP